MLPQQEGPDEADSCCSLVPAGMLDSECLTCSLVNALQAPLALLLLERRNLVSVCPDQLQLEALRRLHSLQVEVGMKTLTQREAVSWGKRKE